MTLDKTISPITQKENVSVFCKLNSRIVIRDYKKKLGIDVNAYYADKCLNLMVCNDTGYKFYMPYSLVGDSKFYEDLQRRSPYYPGNKKEYDIAYENIVSRVGVNGVAILDVGCGDGTFLSRFSNGSFSLGGLEYNDVSVEKCHRLGLDVKKESIESHSRANEGRYDVVTIFQVLEHVPDVSFFLNAALRCLKPGGLLFVAVPNNDPFYARYHLYSTSNVPPHHMGLWNIASLKSLQNYFPVLFLESSYDQEIPWYHLAFYKAKLQIHKLFPWMSNSLLIHCLSAFPFVVYLIVAATKKSLGLHKKEFGRVIAIYERT